MSKNSYRKLAMLLVFTIVAGVFTQGPGVVWAAPLDLTSYLSGLRMSAGVQNSVPATSLDSAEDLYEDSSYHDQAVFSWPLQNNESESTTVLSYYIADGMKVDFTLLRNGGTVDVNYELKRFVSPAGWTLVTASSYTVYDGSRGKIASTAFVSNGGYGVLDYNSPHFQITNNSNITRGFSFIFNGRTVHFMWDYNNSIFYYATDGIQPGIVYNFTLEQDGEKSSKSVYITEAPTFEPFSYENVSGKAVLEQKVEKGEPYETAIASGPGAEMQKLQIKINVPRVWNTSDNAYSAYLTTSMAMVLLLRGSDNNVEIRANISDITASPPTVVVTSHTGLSTIVRNNGVVTITLDEMQAGRIFSVDLQSNADRDLTGIYTRNLLMPFGSAYTLMRFIVITKSNDYFVRMWPYANVAGKYTMASLESGKPDPKVPAQIAWVWTTLTGKEEFMDIPTTLDAVNSTKYYTFMFEPSGRSAEVRSQYLRAWISGGKDFLEVPNMFKISSAELVREEDYFTGTRGELKLTLVWDIGKVSVINSLLANRDPAAGQTPDQMTIEYDLRSTLSPYNAPNASFASISLTLISSGTAVSESAFIVTGDGVVLAGEGDVYTDTSTLTGAQHYYTTVTLTVPALKKGYEPNPPLAEDVYFYYPEIYYLCIEPVSEDGAKKELGYTPYDSFTLNPIIQPEVSAPQNAKVADAVTVTSGESLEVSIAYSFDMPAAAIKEYMEYYYELYTSDAALRLNFYISEDESALSKGFYQLSPEEKKNASAIVDYEDEFDKELYFSIISGSSAMAVASPAGVYNDARDALRDGHIVCISDISLSSAAMVLDMLQNGKKMETQRFVFDGLDKNQKYYIYSEIVITHMTSDGNIALYAPDDNTNLVKWSKMSSLVGITTKGDPVTPKPEEKVPSAPKVSVENVDADNATIVWDRIVPASGEIIEYEVIRTYNTPMIDELLTKNELDFEDVWKDVEATYKRGMLTSGESEMLLWSGSAWWPDVSQNEYFYNNPYSQDTKLAAYTDNTLTPNRIYYYYVRTVKTVNGVSAYSNWGRVTLTTKPVKNPNKLRIEPPKKDPAYLNYDLQTQVMFSFEAQIIPDRVGSDFNFYYQLKEEGEGWRDPEPMDPSMLDSWAEETTTKGVWKYLYKITTGLKPGKSYTIRVFTRDVNDNDSLYTDPATFKTDANQKDYDEQEALDTWLKYFKDELQKLLKDPFWRLYDTSSRLELVYRPTMFNSLITEATDANIALYGTDSDNAVYYLPASALMEANNANKGFKIVHGNMEIIIPAKVIDDNLNTVLTDMKAKVKAGTIADYYIRLTLNWRGEGSVDGAAAATKSAEIRFEAVESSVTAEKWDKDMFNLLADEVLKRAEDSGLIDDIKDRIEDGKTSEEMIKFIDAEISDIVSDFSSTLSSELKGTIKSSYNVSPNKQFTIVAKDTPTTAIGNGYEQQGGAWVLKDTIAYANGRAMYSAAAGTFVFTGRSPAIDALTGIPDAALITSIVYKYNLEDYFGTLNYATLEQNVNRDMLAGVVARIAGAPRGAEPIDWLTQNKKLALSKRNSQSPIEIQEALYLMMSLYEFKTNTKVSNIQVKNYALTNNMVGLEDKYRPYVRAAFELGLYTNKNMQPSNSVKVKEVLSILGSLDKRVKL